MREESTHTSNGAMLQVGKGHEGKGEGKIIRIACFYRCINDIHDTFNILGMILYMYKIKIQ